MTWRRTDGRRDDGSRLPGHEVRVRHLGPPIPFVHGSHTLRDKFALSRRARRALFLLFAITLPAYLATPYLALPFMVAVMVIITSAQSSGRAGADDG